MTSHPGLARRLAYLISHCCTPANQHLGFSLRSNAGERTRTNQKKAHQHQTQTKQNTPPVQTKYSKSISQCISHTVLTDDLTRSIPDIAPPFLTANDKRFYIYTKRRSTQRKIHYVLKLPMLSSRTKVLCESHPVSLSGCNRTKYQSRARWSPQSGVCANPKQKPIVGYLLFVPLLAPSNWRGLFLITSWEPMANRCFTTNISNSIFYHKCQGRARTQSPTTRNYAVEIPTFGELAGVVSTVAQSLQWL